MILYLDTSALVKAYITENASREVLAAMKQAKIVASHSFAYVEAHSTFSRIKREKKLNEQQYDSVTASFKKDWGNYLQIENTKILIEHAADLVEALALRAYDSVHLAAADMLSKKLKQNIIFACFDRQLNKAAHILGLSLLEL